MIFTNNERNFELKYSFKSLRLLEQDLGVKLAQIEEVGLDSMDSISKVFRCGLIHQDKDITLEKSDDLLDEMCSKQSGFSIEVIEAFTKDTSNFFTKESDKKKSQNKEKKQ